MNKQFYLTRYLTLTSITTPDQSEPGTNVNEGVLHISRSFRTGALPPDAVYCHFEDPR